MPSTGIDALDARLGGLVEGRYYLVSGAPGTGKTSVALHFVGAGLEEGQPCAILTQDDPEDLLAQAEFLGYDLREHAEEGRLAILQYRLDFAHNYTRVNDPERLVAEMASLLDDTAPARFVIDSLVPFLDAGGDDTTPALAFLLERTTATTYVTVPGDVGDAHYWRIYDRVVTGAAGIFHLERCDGQVRELSLRKLRQTAESTEPLRFTIVPGVGLQEQPLAPSPAEVPPELRRRVILLHASVEVSEELRAGLENAYDLQVHDGVESAFAELATGSFGALVIAVDPREADPVFALVRQLRKLGVGAPILYFSPRAELRGSTRARGVRAGGDEFLTDDLSPQELLERLDAARARGHRVSTDLPAAENVVLQPTGDDGEPLPIGMDELRRAVRHQVEHASHPYFAVVTLRPPKGKGTVAWKAFCQQLRTGEGDLVARMPDGRIAMYLHDVNRRHLEELVARVVASDPRLAGVRDVDVWAFPVDRAEIEAWLEGSPARHAAQVAS